MATSLFNGNLARDAGVTINTNPYGDEKLGMEFKERGLFIPMQRHGNVVGLETFKPTRDEVFEAMARDDGKVIFLDSYSEYEPAAPGIGASQTNVSDVITIRKWMAPSGETQDDQDIGRAMIDSVMVTAEEIDKPASDTSTGDSRVGISAFVKDKPHSGVNAERVAQIFGCGLERARNTLSCTTQHAVRSAEHPLSRRYRTDLMSMRYRRLNTRFGVDNMMFKTTSLRGNKLASVFTTDEGFVRAYPLKSKAMAGDALDLLAQDVGIPNSIVCDNAGEFLGDNKKFRQRIRYYRINQTTIEPLTPKQNPTERVIGEVRRRTRDLIRRKLIPHRLWDYVLMYVSQLMSVTWNPKLGRTGHEAITGDTPDISEFIDFEFYDKVWFWDSPHREQPARAARWIGIAHRVGSALCFWVIDGESMTAVKSRTSVQHVTDSELKKDEVKKQFEALDKCIEKRCDKTNHVSTDTTPSFYEEDLASWEEFLGEVNEGIDEPEPVQPDLEVPEIDDVEDTYDAYIGLELILDTGPEGDPKR